MFTNRELDLISKALSYMIANKSEVEEALDVYLDASEIDILESKIYSEKDR